VSDFFEAIGDILVAPFRYPLWPFTLALLAALALITFMLVSAIFSVWLERKVAGRIQDRLGTTRVGGKFGWLQTLADGLSCSSRKDIIPATADRLPVSLWPLYRPRRVTFHGLHCPALRRRCRGPQDEYRRLLHARDHVHRWSSASSWPATARCSKWSLFGGMREAAQMVSYEVPMAMCVLVAGHRRRHNEPQRRRSCDSRDWPVTIDSPSLFWNWFVFNDPFTFAAFWTYFTCATASLQHEPRSTWPKPRANSWRDS